MPQISERPPPYSLEWTSFPPPLLDDADSRAWAFQRAFEGARDFVRYGVMVTFKGWAEDWEMKGREVRRDAVQEAYSRAPEALKKAVDWQLKWDTPALICNDYARRCLEHDRKKEAGTYSEVLSPDEFVREFNAASPKAQNSVLGTYSWWTRPGENEFRKRPSRHELQAAYEAAPRPLQAALCLGLEIGGGGYLQNVGNVERCRTDMQIVIDAHKANTRKWNAMGKKLDLW